MAAGHGLPVGVSRLDDRADPVDADDVTLGSGQHRAPRRGAADGDTTTIASRVVEIVLRRKWWVIQAVVLVPLLVGLATSQQQKQYTASASLLLRDVTSGVLQDGGSTYVDPTRQAATNESLVVLPAIADRAAALAGDGITAKEVLSSVRVEPAGDSDVVEISSITPDPRRSAAIANAYGRGYIAFRRDVDRSQLQEAIDTVERGIAALTPEQREGPGGERLRAQLDRLRLVRSLQTGNAELVQRATAPTKPSAPNLRRNLILGVVLGIMLGAGLAFLRDRFDQSLRTPEQLEEVYRLPLIARVPRSKEISRFGTGLDDASAEAFRTLRSNLRYFSVSRDLRSILVSSPVSGDGKSTVARHLAATMAAMGDSVILVEADLHRFNPTLDDGSGPMRGLSSVLSGMPLEHALWSIPVDHLTKGGDRTRALTVLPSGPIPPNPSELLESRRMVEVLEELEHHYERVIIDSPALTQVSDARPLVGRVSGVLIVSAINHTRRAAAEDYIQQLELLGANPLGVVANLLTPQQHGRYASYG